MKKTILRVAGSVLLMSSMAGCVTDPMPLDPQAQVPEPRGEGS